MSKLAWFWLPSVYLETRSIIASKCVSKVARLLPPTAYLETSSITACRCITWTHSSMASNSIAKLPRLQTASSHHHGLQVHMSKIARSRLPTASPNLIDLLLRVYLWVHSLTVWWNGGARRQAAHHQHSAAPSMASKGSSSPIPILARGA